MRSFGRSQNLDAIALNLTRLHEFEWTFSYGDALPVVWVSTADHEVTGIRRTIWEDKSRVTITY